MGVEPEERRFEAETRQLLDLMIHSLYTDKEIFLRELISNASDALDKLRFASLTEPGLVSEGEDLEIRLEPDQDRRLLTVRDNGIGMSREEVISNIGSIARSGTQEMLQNLNSADKEALPDLIGRFGVGFYSAFMVSDRVVIETRKAGTEESTHWESEADGTYTLSDGSKSSQGTSITLHLKSVDRDSGIEDFTDEWVLSRVVRRYSDFISYPIRQNVRRERRDTDEKGIIKPDGKTTVVFEDKTLNSMKPIWSKPEAEVSEEEYGEFYKHVTGDWEDPLLHLRCRAEGISEHESVLFVPARAAPDLDLWESEYGLQLYARRVLIMERCEAALPRFLRFVRGVVDSSDLPLNISRQKLQEDRYVKMIRKFLTRKLLDKLKAVQRDDAETYGKFWEHFGRALKEGVVGEPDTKKRLEPLLLFASSADPEKLTTLAEYVERMKEGQDAIYYLTGDSRAIVERSPVMEAFAQRKVEVLFLTDHIDEILVDRLEEFDGKKLRSAAKGDLDLGAEDSEADPEEERKDQKKRLGDLFGVLGKHLEDKVKRVQLSSRLTESPACLTSDDGDMSPGMERILRMQQPGSATPRQKRVLEVNGTHAVVQGLNDCFQRDKTDPVLKDFAELLFGYATLAEGADLEDPGPFNKALEGIMTRGARQAASTS